MTRGLWFESRWGDHTKSNSRQVRLVEKGPFHPAPLPVDFHLPDEVLNQPALLLGRSLVENLLEVPDVALSLLGDGLGVEGKPGTVELPFPPELLLQAGDLALEVPDQLVRDVIGGAGIENNAKTNPKGGYFSVYDRISEFKYPDTHANQLGKTAMVNDHCFWDSSPGGLDTSHSGGLDPAGGPALWWPVPTEWAAYELNVAATDTYVVMTRFSSSWDPSRPVTIHITLDGASSGPITFKPDDPQIWTDKVYLVVGWWGHTMTNCTRSGRLEAARGATPSQGDHRQLPREGGRPWKPMDSLFQSSQGRHAGEYCPSRGSWRQVRKGLKVGPLGPESSRASVPYEEYRPFSIPLRAGPIRSREEEPILEPDTVRPLSLRLASGVGRQEFPPPSPRSWELARIAGYP